MISGNGGGGVSQGTAGQGGIPRTRITNVREYLRIKAFRKRNCKSSSLISTRLALEMGPRIHIM
jgi:hypothetical protein